MTSPDDFPGLHDLLDRATDRLETPPLAGRALVLAGKRRTLRRGATVAAVVTAVGVVGVGSLIATRDDAGPARPTTPTTTTSTSDDPTEPTPTEPTIDPAIVQERWDPRDVDDLPVDSGIIPGLPDVVTPPPTATALSESPLTEYAVLAVHRETAIKVLSANGEWRSIPLADEGWSRIALSPGGQQLAIRYDGRTEVWGMLTGEMHRIDDPPGFRPSDDDGVMWIDEATLLLDDLKTGWLVDVATENTVQAPYPRDTWAYASVDPRGMVVETRDWGKPAAIEEWSGGDEPRVIPTPEVGHLFGIETSNSAIAGTAYDGEAFEHFAAFVLDRASGEPQAVLPILDYEGNYSNWALRVESIRFDGSVLLMVAAIDKRGVSGERLVRWEPDTGRLSVVGRINVEPPEWVTFAREALY